MDENHIFPILLFMKAIFGSILILDDSTFLG
jgi:hypothetical protein